MLLVSYDGLVSRLTHCTMGGWEALILQSSLTMVKGSYVLNGGQVTKICGGERAVFMRF